MVQPIKISVYNNQNKLYLLHLRFVYKPELILKHEYDIFYLFPIFQLLNHIGVLHRNSCKPKIVFNYFAIKYKPNISMWITIPACLLSHTILYVQIWRAPFTKQTKSHFMVLKNCFLFELQESQHDAYFKSFYIRHIFSRILLNVNCKQIQNRENTVFG